MLQALLGLAILQARYGPLFSEPKVLYKLAIKAGSRLQNEFDQARQNVIGQQRGINAVLDIVSGLKERYGADEVVFKKLTADDFVMDMLVNDKPAQYLRRGDVFDEDYPLEVQLRYYDQQAMPEGWTSSIRAATGLNDDRIDMEKFNFEFDTKNGKFGGGTPSIRGIPFDGTQAADDLNVIVRNIVDRDLTEAALKYQSPSFGVSELNLALAFREVVSGYYPDITRYDILNHAHQRRGEPMDPTKTYSSFQIDGQDLSQINIVLPRSVPLKGAFETGTTVKEKIPEYKRFGGGRRTGFESAFRGVWIKPPDMDTLEI